MKNTLSLSIVLLLSLFLYSCGPTVETVNTSDKKLSQYKSFAYLPNSNFDNLDMGYDDKTVGESVINQVNMNLKKAGYELDRENPDLLVLINTKTSTGVTKDADPIYATYPYNVSSPVSPYYDPYYYNYYFGYGDVVGYDVNYDRYKDGTLIVDLVDRKTKEVIWSGAATDEIYMNNESKAISQYVDDLFKDFPTVADY